MKQAFYIVYVSWLAVVSTGLSIDLHYCMGRLHSIGLNANAADCFQDEEDFSPCCDDKSLTIKSSSETAPPELNLISLSGLPKITDRVFVEPDRYLRYISNKYYSQKRFFPPPKSTAYLSVFRI